MEPSMKKKWLSSRVVRSPRSNPAVFNLCHPTTVNRMQLKSSEVSLSVEILMLYAAASSSTLSPLPFKFELPRSISSFLQFSHLSRQ
ncbi:hypothetical protein Mapa_008183 [Marchantia paleacea]|nr:hypothetical protein Mapa_008183 [Marchantia paleacea]